MSLLCSQKLPITRPVSSMDKSVARAAFLTSTLWNVGDTIRIYFIEPIPTNLEWREPWTNDSKFLDPLYQSIQGKVDPTDVNQSDIRILFKQGIGCSSIVGNSRSIPKLSTGTGTNIQPAGQPEPTMKYSWLDVSTVLHEFCHALGMIHEHQNPQGNPIKWNETAVYCYYKSVNPRWTDDDVKRNVLDTYQKDQINGSSYDQASIMIYSFPENVQCNGENLPLTLNSPPLKINPNYRLSNTDIELLKLMYPFNGKRDIKSIENVPVVPTDVYQLSDKAQLVREFFEEHYKTIIGVVGGLVGLIVVYKLLRWGFAKKKTQSNVSS
jgi:hypothetical protein